MLAIPPEADWLGGGGVDPPFMYERGDCGGSFDAHAWDRLQFID
jgi:hypothetical protein